MPPEYDKVRPYFFLSNLFGIHIGISCVYRFVKLGSSEQRMFSVAVLTGHGKSPLSVNNVECYFIYSVLFSQSQLAFATNAKMPNQHVFTSRW